MTLQEFLFLAKKSIYAARMGQKNLKNEGKQLIFIDSGFTYIDTYYGFDPFSGQELVVFNKKAIWSMNYFGYKKPNSYVDAKQIYKFLRQALSSITEKKPFRGPSKVEENEFHYINFTDSYATIENFIGFERIYYKGLLVYELFYHGGEIK